jgi:hypothetical protein
LKEITEIMLITHLIETSHINKRQWHNLHRAMHNFGLDRIGSGAYSDVYHNPKYGYVVKIFDNFDVNYLAYLEMISAINNPHFPKVLGKPQTMFEPFEEYFAVKLEHLEPFNTLNTDTQAVINWMEDPIERFCKKSTDMNFDRFLKFVLAHKDIRGTSLEKQVREFIKSFPDWNKAIDVLKQVFSTKRGTVVDLLNNNILNRNSVPVITDPFG